MQTVGLAMIVRDSAGPLQRCLDSVEGIVDSAFIIDTGSTDETVIVARDFGATVCTRPWVNYGHNRTELMEMAKGSADYLLILDADDVVEEHDPRPLLSAPYYHLARQDGILRWRVPLLVHGQGNWRYVGSVHEYLDGTAQPFPLDWLTVHHHPAERDEVAKLQQHLELLEAEVAADPSNPRAVFYLAQTYKDLGRRTEAATFYKIRALMGGWEEEAWYAQYQAAELEYDMEGLLEAYRRRPSRYEPLYALARIARWQADQTADPDDVLFVHARER